MPKNRNANFLNFLIRSVRYSVRFDRYCVRGSWWTALATATAAANEQAQGWSMVANEWEDTADALAELTSREA